MCVLSWVCGRKSVRLAGVRWLAWWLVLKAVCCVFLVVVISGVFSSVVVNNSLRLVRLEAAVCSTLSASLRGVLNSECSETPGITAKIQKRPRSHNFSFQEIGNTQ